MMLLFLLPLPSTVLLSLPSLLILQATIGLSLPPLLTLPATIRLSLPPLLTLPPSILWIGGHRIERSERITSVCRRQRVLTSYTRRQGGRGHRAEDAADYQMVILVIIGGDADI